MTAGMKLFHTHRTFTCCSFRLFRVGGAHGGLGCNETCSFHWLIVSVNKIKLK